MSYTKMNICHPLDSLYFKYIYCLAFTEHYFEFAKMIDENYTDCREKIAHYLKIIKNQVYSW